VKLDDAAELAVEERLREDWQRPTGAAVGRVRPYPGGLDRYVDHLVGTMPDDADLSWLGRLRVVVDCANGAAYQAAPKALSRLGVDVLAIHASPDGLNINKDCGSTHLDDLRAAVREVDADLGFLQAMAREQITVEQTPVGDRYVLAAMNRGDRSLGGEQSGHVILRDHATTGDGVLTAVQVLGRMAGTGASLADLAGVMTALPQVLVNVSGVDRGGTDHPDVVDALDKAVAELGSEGRVLLRPSGTEPVVRVMVEAATEERARQVADQLAGVVRVSLRLA
ncbi:MAG: phosphoglucosamine mutase, partial [Actinomycetota bacterium]|nr:phosphoglucosamine mutase [Actinomycetota bacterium]